MTTPQEPRRSVRAGGVPREGADAGGSGRPAGWPPEDERWTPADRYVVERGAGPDDDALGGPPVEPRDRHWEPQARRRTPLWASAGLAALLAVVLVALVLVAVVLPNLDKLEGSGTTVSPSASVAASAATASPSPTPRPSRSPRPSRTPVPSVVEVEVKPGDSLTSIAAEYETKARSIAFWNRDRYPTLDPQSPDYEPDNIQVGWTLVVYPGEVFVEPGASGSPGTSGPPAVASPSSSG